MDQSRRRFLTNILDAAVVVFGALKLLLALTPEPTVLKPITGTLNVTLDPLVAGPYTLAAETGSFTLTGGAASMRVSGA